MVHVPKDVPVFLEFLPTNLRDCYTLIKVYGQWFITAEDQGRQDLANGFENILDHLRYRYIKLQNLQDPESTYIVSMYEQLMPVEFHFSPVEHKDVEPKVCSINTNVESQNDSIEVDPVVDDPPTPPSSPTPIELELIQQEKMRLLTSVITKVPVTDVDVQVVVDADAINEINNAPKPDTVVLENKDVPILVDEQPLTELGDESPTLFIQPKKLGTLHELQDGLDPKFTIGKRCKPLKPHVKQMIKNIRRGGVILQEPDGNVAARQLLRAEFGSAIAYQKDYICIGGLEKIEGQKLSAGMRKFILSIQSEAKSYDFQ